MALLGTALVGSLFGDRYRVEALIGSGGMASVYRARDESLGRAVALKVLTGASLAGDAAVLQREQSEVQLLASLSHPSLVTLFDARNLPNDVIDEEHLCLVMELVDGPTLAERIATGSILVSDVAHLAADIAEALHVVHANGVVHRDIKPANILLVDSAQPDREFRAKLADFGIASLVDSTRITATGTLMGTAAFLSPEQALGRPPAPPTDVYSLGLVLLETLTGKREFTGTMLESVAARLNRDPEVPSSLGDDWVALLTSMTARDPADRPTALDVSVAARRILVADAQGASPTVIASVAHDEATAAMPTPTRVMDAPTVAHDVSTQVLPDRAGPAPESRPSRRPARLVIWAAAIAVAVLLLAVAIVPRLVAQAPEEPTTQQLPVNEGELGEHLQQLLESVTP